MTKEQALSLAERVYDDMEHGGIYTAAGRILAALEAEKVGEVVLCENTLVGQVHIVYKKALLEKSERLFSGRTNR
jgi:hypothetical protein